MSYRIGVGVVLTLVILAAGFSFGFATTSGSVRDVNRVLRDSPYELPAFSLVDSRDEPVTSSDYANSVWVASFLFTRCDQSCPNLVVPAMAEVQEGLAGTGARLVSVTVDPAYDSPAILAAYARQADADPERWTFLTGPTDEVRGLIRNGFKLTAIDSTEEAIAQGAELVTHQSKLALVAPGNQVVGYYDAANPEETEALIRRATVLAKRTDPAIPGWAWSLPPINASLNGACTLTLFAAWILILNRRWKQHATMMVASLGLSAIFLGCYLVYHAYVGSIPFEGLGLIRPIYYTILISHVVLAAGMLPLIFAAVWFAARRKFDRHKAVARIALPIWLYVSVTGVVVYLMLYQLDLFIGPPPVPSAA